MKNVLHKQQRVTFVSTSMHLKLLGRVPQWSGSLPSKSLMSGFAPFSSNSSIRETAPVNAAIWIAVDPSDAWSVERTLIDQYNQEPITQRKER